MAGGEILVAHGVGHRDEVGGDAPGALFGGAKDEVRQPTLKTAEGRAVDGVDDDGHAGAGGGEAPKDAGLAAVGVDDVRLSGRSRKMAR